MILRPLLPETSQPVSSSPEAEPAWAVISRLQGVEAEQYLLVGQPDHAKLSGDLAATMRAPFLPKITALVSRAIAVHDAGWAQIPFERDLQGDPPRTNTGRPQHFMQVPLAESLSAWTGSIKAAGEVSPLGEYMVSAHFSRIAHLRLQMELDSQEDVAHLKGFIQGEEEYQAKLEPKTGVSAEALAGYIDLLQFCDLLSLYLCCGAKDAVEFPQEFHGQKIVVRYEEGVYTTTPSIFDETHRFHVPVRVYPTKSGEGKTMVGFHLK
jgi:hypothetical protein